MISLLITTLTGFPILRHGTIGPPHILGLLTLVVLAVAAASEKTRRFGRASLNVKTVTYSMTVLFLMIPAVTETLTRVPPSNPLVAGPDASILTLFKWPAARPVLDRVTAQLCGMGAAHAH